MAQITQNGQKCLVFIVLPQLRITGRSGFVKKEIVMINNKDSNNNDDNVTEVLNTFSNYV